MEKRNEHNINEEGIASVEISNNEQHVIKPKFRSDPMERLSNLEVDIMLKEKGFFDLQSNKSVSSFSHSYVPQKEGKVIFDSTSGLMWQQSGSNNSMAYKKAKTYISQLNKDRFAGYYNWRLPTLEEAMSLMEPTIKNGELYIDPLFDNTQTWIWTADCNLSDLWFASLFCTSLAWVVYYIFGNCDTIAIGSYDYYVRAVRSEQ